MLPPVCIMVLLYLRAGQQVVGCTGNQVPGRLPIHTIPALGGLTSEFPWGSVIIRALGLSYLEVSEYKRNLPSREELLWSGEAGPAAVYANACPM